jgi:hypothetical protein
MQQPPETLAARKRGPPPRRAEGGSTPGSPGGPNPARQRPTQQAARPTGQLGVLGAGVKSLAVGVFTCANP